MKALLIGNTDCYGAKRLQEEFNKSELILDAVRVSDLVFRVHEGNTLFTDAGGRDLYNYDTYIFRGIGKNIHELSVLARYLKSHGKVIVEDVLTTQGMYIDKFTPTMVDDNIPTLNYTTVFSEQSELFSGVEYPTIVKSLDGSMGRKVRLVQNKEDVRKCAGEFGYPVMLQQFIPVTHDYRVLVVDGEPIGAMARYNQEGDFLTIRAGGKRENASLPKEALDVAVRAAKVAGLSIAGVDLLEHEGVFYRLEVNMSPQFRVFERVTGVNVAEKIVDCVLKQYNG